MKKKIVSALLCATMLTGMLAGCGKTDTNDTQQAAATGDTENVSTSDDGKVLNIYC